MPAVIVALLHTDYTGFDHGGPICTKIELPKDWERLCRDYSAGDPDYFCYRND